jgi:hypothetical protein
MSNINSDGISTEGAANLEWMTSNFRPSDETEVTYFNISSVNLWEKLSIPMIIACAVDNRIAVAVFEVESHAEAAFRHPQSEDWTHQGMKEDNYFLRQAWNVSFQLIGFSKSFCSIFQAAARPVDW